MVGTSVQSFVQLSGRSSHALKQRRHLSSSTRVLNGHKEDDANSASLRYGIGGVDLSDRWVELVSGGHVTATTELKEEDGHQKGLRVRYGVRSKRQGRHQPRLLEFVEMLSLEDEQSNSKLRERIVFINETLSNMQQLGNIDEAGNEEGLQNNNGLAIQCIYEGHYAAQLQLVRTLRPPRSQEMSSKDNEQATCQCPPYDASKDSFLVGSLRLFGHGKFHGEGEPRERAARVCVPRCDTDRESTTASSTLPWDIYHNISPVDPRGHFLLLPAIDDKREWRDQSLTKSDCSDVTNLASAIEPAGSLCLSFNSVGAGASQNHIHCHAWVCPPPPLLAKDGGYAVEKALATSSLTLEHGIIVSLLDYPCTSIKLSSPDVGISTLKEMGDALYRVVQMAQEMGVPHNVAWMNSPEGVAVYVFIRRAETSSAVEVGGGGIFRLGASEMVGVFHSSSREQLGALAGNMKSILADVSWEPRQSLWEDIRKALE